MLNYQRVSPTTAYDLSFGTSALPSCNQCLTQAIDQNDMKSEEMERVRQCEAKAP